MSDGGRRHAAVIGLDGLPVPALLQAVRLGYMPFTASLLNKAVLRNLFVDLPFTLSSWSSISTGCNPGKHGVFDCIMPKPHGEPELVTRKHLERPTFTEIAAMNKLKAITINVPMTCPPVIRRNHIVVSDWTYPKITAWPETEAPTVRKFMEREGPPKTDSIEEWVENVLNTAERRAEMIKHFYISKDWDVFYAVIPETDWVFHFTFGEIMENKGIGRKALKLFSLIDRTIKEIVSNAPENTLLTICSDHGFMTASKSLNINVLLKKAGLLVSRMEELPLKVKVVNFMAKYAPAWLKNKVKYGAGFILAKKLHIIDAFTTGKIPVDYGRSKAYATIAYNVYVNPALSEEEKKATLEKVMNLLKEYGDMLDVLKKGDEYFKGPYVSRAPSVVIIPKEGTNISTRLMYRNVIEHGKWYIHSSYGTLLMKDIDGDTRFNIPSDTVRNVDVATTVLAYVGLPLDPDMDGSVLIEGRQINYRRYRPAYAILKKKVLAST